MRKRLKEFEETVSEQALTIHILKKLKNNGTAEEARAFIREYLTYTLESEKAAMR